MYIYTQLTILNSMNYDVLGLLVWKANYNRKMRTNKQKLHDVQKRHGQWVRGYCVPK